MAKMKQSWKTTAVALTSAVVSGVLLILNAEDIITADKMAVYLSVVNSILAVFGFAVSKDFNVTGDPPRAVKQD